MKKIIWLIAFVGMTCFVASAGKPVTLFLVGDETMADSPNLTVSAACGWGQSFPTYLQGINVENHAVDNASSRSYIQDGHWNMVLARAKRNDLVFIQLGMHDIYPEDSTRYSSIDDFATNITKMITAAQKKGLRVVLLTPISPCFFKDHAFHHRLGAYPDVIRHAAAAYGLPLVDLEQWTAQQWQLLGEDRARTWFVSGSEVRLLTEGALAIGQMTSNSLREQNVKYIVKYLKEKQDPIFTQPWQAPVIEEVAQ